MSRPASFKLSELMKGYITMGETEVFSGYRKGLLAGTFVEMLTILAADDVKRFVEHPDHLAQVTGKLKCPALGGDLPIEGGQFQLLATTPNDYLRRMNYRLFVTGTPGKLTFSGFKTLSDNPNTGIWFDLSWLWMTIYPGHISPEEEAATKPVGAGIIHLYKIDFITYNVLTFRIRGPWLTPIAGAYRFSRFFLGAVFRFWLTKYFGRRK